ncbi:MAG: SET domain-containing protein [Planctomycetota bacterium]
MFKVKPSGIHGLGLFADRFIPADTVIGRLEGSYTTQDGAYVLWLSEEQGFRVENEMRYVNHAAEPNAAYYDDLTVTAVCDIQPGEEITHNYLGDDADDAELDEQDDWPEVEVVVPAVSSGLTPAPQA